jgi:TrkA domain protein
MQINIEVHDLPGIGRRYDVHGEHGGRIAVVLHNTGRRDVYSYEGGRGGGDIGDDDADAVVQLSDAQARQLGAILGGAYFKPAMVEEVEAVIGALLIDWLTLGEDSPAVGKTIERLEIRQRTGMTIVAIVRGREAIPMPAPDEVLRAGDRLVVVGRREDSPRLASLMEG